MSTFENIINRQIILVGGSGSGKTTAIWNIIYDIAPKLQEIYLIATNNDAIKEYDQIIPHKYWTHHGTIINYALLFSAESDPDDINSEIEQIIKWAKVYTFTYEWVRNEKIITPI